jgi:hypothetical protein
MGEGGGGISRNTNYDFGINRNYLLNSDTFNIGKSRLRVYVKSTKDFNMSIETVFNVWKIIRVIVKECEKYLLTKYYCVKQGVAILYSFRKASPVLQNNACVPSTNKQLHGSVIQSFSYSRLLRSPEVHCRVCKSPPVNSTYCPSYFSSVHSLTPHSLSCYPPSMPRSPTQSGPFTFLDHTLYVILKPPRMLHAPSTSFSHQVVVIYQHICSLQQRIYCESGLDKET